MPDLVATDVAEKIVDCLLTGGGGQEVSAALNNEIEGLALTLDPVEQDLPAVQLRATLEFWRGLPQVEGVADVVRIRPEPLIVALGYIMLIDLGERDDDFRYALYGSKIARVSGFDLTGKSVWDAATTSTIRTFFAACYMAARRLKRPLYTVHDAPPTITVSQWHRLILPLGRGGQVKRFLVCNVPIHNGRVR